MATVINNPGNNSGDGYGSIVAVIVLVVVLIVAGALFFIYALPAIQNSGTPSIDVNIKLPPGVTLPATTP